MYLSAYTYNTFICKEYWAFFYHFLLQHLDDYIIKFPVEIILYLKEKNYICKMT